MTAVSTTCGSGWLALFKYYVRRDQPPATAGGTDSHPKETVGQNPPDNAIRRSEQKGNYTMPIRLRQAVSECQSAAYGAANLAFTVSLTAFPSGFLPASFAIAAFITTPMSFMDELPVSAMAALTA